MDLAKITKWKTNSGHTTSFTFLEILFRHFGQEVSEDDLSDSDEFDFNDVDDDEDTKDE